MGATFPQKLLRFRHPLEALATPPLNLYNFFACGSTLWLGLCHLVFPGICSVELRCSCCRHHVAFSPAKSSAPLTVALQSTSSDAPSLFTSQMTSIPWVWAFLWYLFFSLALFNLVSKNWYLIIYHQLPKPGTLVPWILESSSFCYCKDFQDSFWVEVSRSSTHALTELQSANHAPTGSPKTMHIEPTWGIEAICVIVGSVGLEDIHSCVVGCADGIGSDPRDHHIVLYESIPAKGKHEVINLHVQDLIS